MRESKALLLMADLDDQKAKATRIRRRPAPKAQKPDVIAIPARKGKPAMNGHAAH